MKTSKPCPPNLEPESLRMGPYRTTWFIARRCLMFRISVNGCHRPFLASGVNGATGSKVSIATLKNGCPFPFTPGILNIDLGSFRQRNRRRNSLPFGPEIETAPSMSFRTMLPTAPALPFIKLPVAIWMTSEMRSLQAKSIHMGPRISTIIEDILDVEQGFDGKLDFFRKMPHGTFVIKIVWMTLRVSFSVVFRSTDAWTRNDNSLAITVASLFTALPHKSDPLSVS